MLGKLGSGIVFGWIWFCIWIRLVLGSTGPGTGLAGLGNMSISVGFDLHQLSITISMIIIIIILVITLALKTLFTLSLSLIYICVMIYGFHIWSDSFSLLFCCHLQGIFSYIYFFILFIWFTYSRSKLNCQCVYPLNSSLNGFDFSVFFF